MGKGIPGAVLCSDGGEVRRYWMLPSQGWGEGEIQPGALLLWFNSKQTLPANHRITSTAAQGPAGLAAAQGGSC